MSIFEMIITGIVIIFTLGILSLLCNIIRILRKIPMDIMKKMLNINQTNNFSNNLYNMENERQKG